MKQLFWKPRPREPWADWRTYSLILPILSSTIGACIFTTLAFSFTEVDSLPAAFLRRLVIVGAFAVGVGSTFGSAASGIEIYRKVYARTVTSWDWIALGVSTATTVGGFALGFAALLGAMAQWSETVQIWGPLVLGTLVSLDGLCDLIELGGLFGSFEMRMENWLEEKRQHDVAHGIQPPRDPLPAARLPDFQRVLDRLNGDRDNLNEEQLEAELARDGLGLPSPSSVTRWLKKARQ